MDKTISNKNGLTTDEAKDQLKSFGFNELISSKPKNIWRIALEVMKEPMFILLICCGALYMILGDFKEGIILLSTIFIIIGITFYQYRKTERAMDALKKLSSPRALVIRDGQELRIPGREVVPNDLLILNEGDRVPADAIIIETTHLLIDESVLTGESVPVNKTTDQDHNLIFSSTLIVQGKATAKVIATGSRTEFGKIGTSLQSIAENTTRLQKEMKILIRSLIIIGIVLSIAVVITFYFTRGNFLQSLLNGLAASMAILPEEFPVVLTVFLALGAWRLSKKNVLTRKPSAIETLGSATVLCTDKTGTITQNKMKIANVFIGNKIYTQKEFSENKPLISELVNTAYLASQATSIDPMEKSLKLFVEANSENKIISSTLIKEYPLTKNLLMMTHVHQQLDKSIFVASKGAPEAVIGLCQITLEEKELHLKAVNEMAAKGLRIIAVAKGKSTTNELPENQNQFSFQICGLIGFEDPIRPEVPDAVKECKTAGVKVIMITGDYPATAKSIAMQIGFGDDAKILTGEGLTKLSDEQLQETIKDISIFARVIPEQKLRIVQALKNNNEIVAMTGDGVNDAPALKAAHIGIAMGNKGTDVAREASSLVLLDDNFASIVSAIRLGRKIFDNLQKAMSYIIAIHIPIIGLTLIPAIINSLPLLLLPLHIVFMELIIDPICSVAFEWEKEEKDIMNRPPRKIDEKFFGFKKILSSVLQGFLLLGAALGVYFLSLNEGHSEGEIRAITFCALIIGNIALILTNLSKTRNVFKVLGEKNIPLYLIVIGALGLLMLVISVPPIQKIFGFEFPGYLHFLTSLAAAGIILTILELIKLIKNKRYNIANKPFIKQ